MRENGAARPLASPGPPGRVGERLLGLRFGTRRILGLLRRTVRAPDLPGTGYASRIEADQIVAGPSLCTGMPVSIGHEARTALAGPAGVEDQRPQPTAGVCGPHPRHPQFDGPPVRVCVVDRHLHPAALRTGHGLRGDVHATGRPSDLLLREVRGQRRDGSVPALGVVGLGRCGASDTAHRHHKGGDGQHTGGQGCGLAGNGHRPSRSLAAPGEACSQSRLLRCFLRHSRIWDLRSVDGRTRGADTWEATQPAKIQTAPGRDRLCPGPACRGRAATRSE